MPRWRCPISADTSLHLQKRRSHSFRRRAPEQPRLSHSTRLCISGVTLRARALASPLRNPFVSFENLPPTSTARTTSRARACTPTNSGYLRSLALLAARMATPSISAAPLHGLPSPCNAHTNVVSIANCAPPNSGSPSTTTSKLRPSPAKCVRPHTCALPRETPTAQHPSARTCSTMVAEEVEEVEETATSARTTREGKKADEVCEAREPETSGKGWSFPCKLALV